MSQLALHFLGSPRVCLDGATVEIDRRKVVALLAYLAVTAQRHSRDELAQLLHGKQDGKHARANLRQTLSLLRDAIGEDRLGSDRLGVWLPDVKGLWVDVAAFEQGFIVAGVLVGPHTLNIVGETHDVEVLAEVGVALLLFGIGLELSLDRMRRLWRLIVFGGAIQVGATILAVLLIAGVLGLGARAAVFMGCLVAVSSTAIVLSGLRQRGELEAPHGRVTLGILVFQDLCVVPMMLMIPVLAGDVGSGGDIALALGKAAGLIVAVLLSARVLVPRLLHLVARARQRDLFVLSVFIICLGTAWLMSQAGVSLALGAFLGGLVVAGSEYRHQALADLIPFREVFASLFFVSVGMLLNPLSVGANALPVLAILIAIVIGKFLIVLITGLCLKLPQRPSILAATALAQVGEFSFVLMTAARGYDIVDEPTMANLSAAIILSMLITPMVIALGPRLAAGVGKVPVVTRLLNVRTPDDLEHDVAELHDHVIIAGFGLTGQELAVSLKNYGISYVIVDMNADAVRTASRHGEPACFGDVTSRDVLETLGLNRARELVLVINDPGAAERAVRVARELAPNVPVFVRAQYAADVEPLLRAGTAEVIVAELESSAAVTKQLLTRHGIGDASVDPELQRIRERQTD